jgi:predicted O-methyltransferase YrrM
LRITDRIRRVIGGAARLATRESARVLRDSRNVDLVLSAALQHPGALAIHYPAAYVEFLRSCIEESSYPAVVVKLEGGAPELPTKRFGTLVEQFQSGLPEVEFSTAQELARMADAHRSNAQIQADPTWTWAGDVGLHFSIGSSLGRKGRMLFNAVRFMRSEHCLELGTAYGMSAQFILAALKTYCPGAHLHTLEGAEVQFSIASSTLKNRYEDMVSCHYGLTTERLPDLARSIGPIDFMFHDAGHSYKDYLEDFDQISQALIPGAVVLFDDIRWEDERWKTGTKGAANTYAGWKAVIGHPRVAQAVEIEGNLGLLLVR